MTEFRFRSAAYAYGQSWARLFASTGNLQVAKDFVEKCDGDINLVLSAMSTMKMSTSPEAFAKVRGAWEHLQDLIGVHDGDSALPADWLHSFCKGAASISKSNDCVGNAEVSLAVVALLQEF
jgi:hypothetical protein